MIITLLILLIATLILGAIFKYFLYDILSIPLNGLYAYYSKNGQYIKQAYVSGFGAIFLIFIYTYLFSGICASFLSWTISEHENSFFLKVTSLTLASGIPFSLRRKAINMLSQDYSYSRVPSVMAVLYFPFLVFVISIIMLVFPSIMKFWSWMPYVDL